MHPGKKIPNIEAGVEFQEFSIFIRSLISDETPSEDDLLRVFKVFDKDDDGKLCEAEAAQFNKRIVKTIGEMRTALIVVDFQNDFVSGSLAINRGRAQQDPLQALKILNQLLSHHEEFNSIVYTLDWHPSNHISFYEHCRNQDRVMQRSDKGRKLKPFDVVTFEDPECRQVLYPSHCVEGSWGAELHPEVIRVDGAKIVKKGTDVYVDAYSGFADNNGKIKSDLEKLLKSDDINAVFICGLALDICVAATARDASKLKVDYDQCFIDICLTPGGRSHRIRFSVPDLCYPRFKGLSEEQIHRTCKELRGRNVPYIESTHVYQYLNEYKVPWLWVCQLSGLSERRHRRRKRNSIESDEPTKDLEASHGTEESLSPTNAFKSVLLADA